MISYFISHPEVEVDPEVPVVEWGLSVAGRRRASRISRLCWHPQISQIVTSTERKAVEAASVLSRDVGMEVRTVPELGENDRSATGFLPPTEFELVADEFFARPLVSVRGWEPASAAQERIVAAVRLLTTHPSRPSAIVSHGAVGTLLYCHLTGAPISRQFDQPGQGSWFSFDPERWVAHHGWRRIT